MSEILAYDRDGHPLYKGDLVEWLHDERLPRLPRVVVGRASNGYYDIDGPEQGYVQVSTIPDAVPVHRSQRFGVNLRRIVDPDMVVDTGL